jgi:hypothetical protein
MNPTFTLSLALAVLIATAMAKVASPMVAALRAQIIGILPNF